MNLELTPGTTCVANGKVIQIDGPDSLTTMRVRDVATGTISCVPIAQIEPLPKSTAPSTAEGISAEEWKRCCELAKDLMPLNDRRTVARSQLEKLAKRHHLSVRQLQRARAAFIKDPRASVLARRPGGRPLGLNQLAPEVDQLIRHVIAKHYLRRERPPKEYVVARARSLARRLKLSPPSRSAVLTRIGSLTNGQSVVLPVAAVSDFQLTLVQNGVTVFDTGTVNKAANTCLFILRTGVMTGTWSLYGIDERYAVSNWTNRV